MDRPDAEWCRMMEETAKGSRVKLRPTLNDINIEKKHALVFCFFYYLSQLPGWVWPRPASSRSLGAARNECVFHFWPASSHAMWCMWCHMLRIAALNLRRKEWNQTNCLVSAWTWILTNCNVCFNVAWEVVSYHFQYANANLHELR